MKTLHQIKNDLKQIRIYYSSKNTFDNSFIITGENKIVDTIKLYNEIMTTAPAKLYEIYSLLYVSGESQCKVAYKLNFTCNYIYKLNKQLLDYIQEKLNKENENVST